MTEETAQMRQGRPKDSVKRDEIVAAATQLFLENGFELTSMEAVARKAGVSKLTIYSHFNDKNELFAAIMQYRCIHMGMPDSFMSMQHMDPHEALLQIASTVVAIIYHPDSIRLQRVIYGEAARHPEIVKVFYAMGPKRVRIAVAELLAEFDRQGKLSILDPAIATEQFFSILKGEKLLRTVMLLFPSPEPEELAAHARATVAFFLRAYRPHTPSSVSLEQS